MMVAQICTILFQTGLRELIGFLKRRNDKEGLKNFMEQDKDRISKMDEVFRNSLYQEYAL